MSLGPGSERLMWTGRYWELCVCVCVCVDNHPPHRIHVRVCRVDLVQRRYDTVDLYSGVNSNELLRLAFQARDQIAAFLSTCTVVA